MDSGTMKTKQFRKSPNRIVVGNNSHAVNGTISQSSLTNSQNRAGILVNSYPTATLVDLCAAQRAKIGTLVATLESKKQQVVQLTHLVEKYRQQVINCNSLLEREKEIASRSSKEYELLIEANRIKLDRLELAIDAKDIELERLRTTSRLLSLENKTSINIQRGIQTQLIIYHSRGQQTKQKVFKKINAAQSIGIQVETSAGGVFSKGNSKSYEKIMKNISNGRLNQNNPSSINSGSKRFETVQHGNQQRGYQTDYKGTNIDDRHANNSSSNHNYNSIHINGNDINNNDINANHHSNHNHNSHHSFGQSSPSTMKTAHRNRELSTLKGRRQQEQQQYEPSAQSQRRPNKQQQQSQGPQQHQQDQSYEQNYRHKLGKKQKYAHKMQSSQKSQEEEQQFNGSQHDQESSQGQLDRLTQKWLELKGTNMKKIQKQYYQRVNGKPNNYNNNNYSNNHPKLSDLPLCQQQLSQQYSHPKYNQPQIALSPNNNFDDITLNKELKKKNFSAKKLLKNNVSSNVMGGNIGNINNNISNNINNINNSNISKVDFYSSQLMNLVQSLNSYQ